MIIGLFTRPVAFILSGMMAVAFFADSVARNGNLWTLKDGEASVFYCFAYLFIAAAGAGVISLDHWIWRKSGDPYPFASPKWTPHLLSVMRFMIGYMFIQHGTEKLWGFPSGRIDHNFFSLHGFAGLLEFPGGILLMLGLFTRPTCFILSGQMAVAYWARWAPKRFLAQSDRRRSVDLLLFCVPSDSCDRWRRVESGSALEPPASIFTIANR